MSSLRDWESYFDADTYDPLTMFGVLANRFGLKHDDELGRMEFSATTVRLDELKRGLAQVPQTFDADHLKAIHRYLFQDVYDWAGEYRLVDMSKGASDFAAVKGGIGRYLDEAHQIVAGTHWDWLSQQEFAEESARVFAYVNQAHPFREGNGRTSKRFMADVAKMSHFEFNFSRVDKDLWNQASALSGPDLGAHVPHHEELILVFKMATIRRLRA